jgi:hypothetical protein
MTDENKIFKGDTFTNKSMARDFDTSANRNTFLNFDERANLALIPDSTAIEVDKGVNSDTLAKLNVWGNSDKFRLAQVNSPAS